MQVLLATDAAGEGINLQRAPLMVNYKPEDFILTIVEFIADSSHYVHYVRRPFRHEPEFGVTSVHYDFAKRLARAEVP